jgi:hypothetical protein
MAKFAIKMIAAAAVLAAVSGAAQAHVIDFNTYVGLPNNGTYFETYAPLFTDGYVFTTERNFTRHGHLINNPAFCGQGCAVDGTQYLGGNMANLVMKLVSGGTFSVTTFDATKAYYHHNRPDKIIAEGMVQGGGMVTQTFDLPTDNFGSFQLTGFSNLLTLTFRGADANGVAGDLWIGVDNIAAVPEPATYALLLAGLGGIALLARRRRDRA